MFVVNTKKYKEKTTYPKQEGCINVNVHWIVITDFDHLKKQDNNSAKPSLFQVFSSLLFRGILILVGNFPQ